ncbi:OmpA family protein [Sphingobacterium sp. WM]|uniref:OmpA family protein n=1 Tax=Sphingobacterium sp. WM TaxID=3031802 RepID=UPI00240D4DC0|nr:OmpA family protein [Sphingobacterium sp. WM]WFB62169.1 OmpA family protein [Sphingobacterium sp. WM]
MNKRTILLGILPAFLAVMSCNNAANKDADANSDSISNSTLDTTVTTNPTESANTFNPESLPEATAEMGQFPYYSIPEWLDAKSSYGFDRESDFGKIEFYTGNSFYPVEGKIKVKGYGMTDPKDPGSGKWDEYKFVQSYAKHFESLGAKKLFEGQVPQEQIDALNKANNKDGYFYDFGTSSMENLVTYGLKKGDKVILFAIVSNTAYGAIYVAEAEAFKQTVGIIKADKIEKDLNEKGKSVLQINFDTDKATLKPDGKELVAEIGKVLKSNSSMKLDINGYTDNVGNADHNLQLSKDRANTVLNTLVQDGIDKSRLASNGFGANDFIADNNSEAGKQQNRRVELIKK